MLRKLNPSMMRHIVKSQVRYFSNFDDEINIFTEESDPSSPPEVYKSKLNYTFYNRTFAFVTETPLFTTKKISLSVGKQKMGLLKSASSYFNNDTFFATAILPKPDMSITQFKNTEDFYSIGSYCVVDILDDNTISLKALHKNRIKKIYTMDLPKKASDVTDAVFNDMNIDKDEYFYNLDRLNDQTQVKRKEFFDENDSGRFKVPENLLHLCESEPMEIGTYGRLELHMI